MGDVDAQLGVGGGEEELQNGVLLAGQGLLWTASSLGNMADVEGLVAMKCDIDTPNAHSGNSTPLMIAARKGHFEVVQFLMRKGCLLYTSPSPRDRG